MRTAKEIMEQAFKEALSIVSKYAYPSNDAGNRNIAASNLAIAIFSYEVEYEAMKDSHQQANEDESEDGLNFEDDKNG
jgi:hypothetical protein